MSKNDFTKNAPMISAISTEEIKRPMMPVAEYIQESEDLFHWCQPDKAQLAAAGLDWSLVDDLSSRAGAVRYAQSIWNAMCLTQKDAQKQFEELSPEAYEIRDEMVHHMLFAFRQHPDLLESTRQIIEGKGDADLVQDLSDIYELCTPNLSLLTAIGIKPELVERTGELSQKMAKVLAATRNEPQVSEHRVMRDRAYTYLKQAVDDIREAGRYVFWKNPERCYGYTSDFFRRKNRRRQRKERSDGSSLVAKDAPVTKAKDGVDR